MEKLRQVIKQLNARVETLELEKDREARQRTWFWYGLRVFDSEVGFLSLLMMDLVSTMVLCRLLDLDPASPLHPVLFIMLVTGQFVLQMATLCAVKFVYLNYTYFIAVCAHLVALFHKEFPPVETSDEVSEAYRERDEAQWEKLASLLERYKAHDRICLANDLANDESLRAANKARLLKQGYRLERWAVSDHDNALVVYRETDEASCVLF